MKMIIKLGSILIAIWLISGCGSDNKTRDQYEENISNASTSSSSGSETSGWNSALLQTGQQVSYIPRITSYNVCYTKLLRFDLGSKLVR